MGVVCLFCILLACSLLASSNASAQSSLQLTVGTGQGFPEGLAQVQVSITSSVAPAAVDFDITFDSSKLDAVNVAPGPIVTNIGKQLQWTDTVTPGLLTILVSSVAADNTVMANGVLATITFAVDASASVSDVYPLVVSSLQATTPEPQVIPSSAVNGSVTIIACQTPGTPTKVAASDGTYGDRVEVTWDAVAYATHYDVYRSGGANSAAATLIGTAEATAEYDDTTAVAMVFVAATAGEGCNAEATAAYFQKTYYNYWVKARNVCGTSGFSGPDQGYRGYGKSASTDTVAARTVPAADGSAELGLSDAVAVRVESDAPIAEGSIWGQLTDYGRTNGAVTWIAADPEGGHDVWVIFTPAEEWLPGDIVEFAAGAQTEAGAALGPAHAMWRVADVGQTAAKAVVPGDGLALVIVPAEDTPPAFTEGVGDVYRIQPEAVYGASELLSVPVPEDAAGEVALFCFVNGEWHRGEDVAGWMDGAADVVLLDGARYLDARVRHGAVIRLGVVPVEPELVVTSAMVFGAGLFGDAVLIGLLVLTLGLTARLRPVTVRQ